jgi:hypothetical protein
LITPRSGRNAAFIRKIGSFSKFLGKRGRRGYPLPS